jgi:hypothetical protein
MASANPCCPAALPPGRCPETHKRGFLKKAPFETAKTFLMGSAKQYCLCKPMLQGFFAYFLSLKESRLQSFCPTFFKKWEAFANPCCPAPWAPLPRGGLIFFHIRLVYRAIRIARGAIRFFMCYLL